MADEILELIFFDGGINTKKDPLALEQTELQACSGFDFDRDGQLTVRTPLTATNSTAVGSMHSLTRYINTIYEGDGENVRYKWDLDGYCNQYTPPDEDFTLITGLSSSDRWSIAEYLKFVCLTNGRNQIALSKGNSYKWGVDTPSSAPTVAASGSSNPNGTYDTCYTYIAYFPNGIAVESGPSTTAEVSPASEQIDWSALHASFYSGTNVTVKKRLYREIEGTYYLVAELNNTTTTYTDTLSDTDLQLRATLTTSGYIVPPSNLTQIATFKNRVFGIETKSLWWSEAYLPFNWDTNLVVTKDGEDLTTLVSWGEQLYMASAPKWYRLKGDTPSTWEIKYPFADMGCVNGHTAKATKYGIIGLGYDGIYLFDGGTSKNLTKNYMQDSTFTSINHKYCFAEYQNLKYHFYYPSSGTTIDTHLVLDLTHYPQYRFYNDDFIATAHFYDLETGYKYYGKSNGYMYEEGTSETIITSLTSRELHGGNPKKRKMCKYLHYDVNTNSQDLTVTYYVDGTAQSETTTINTSSRTTKRIDVPGRFEGYRFYIALSCSNSQSLVLYEPWALEFVPTGE